MEACRVDNGDGVGVGAHVLLPAVPPRRMMTGCRLAFHGAAANSRPHSLLWVRAPPPLVVNDDDDDDDDDDDVGGSGSTTTTLPVETVIYASGGVVNLASSHMCAGGNDVTSVDSTLVTRTSDFAHPDMGGGGGGEGEGEGGGAKLARGEAAADAAAPRSVSALAWVAYRDDGGDDGDDDDDDDDGGDRHGGDCGDECGIVAAFSDGTVTSWSRAGGADRRWSERVLVGVVDPASSPRRHAADGRDDGGSDGPPREPIADVSAVSLGPRRRRRRRRHDGGGRDGNRGGGYGDDDDDDDDDDVWLVATASSGGVYLHATCRASSSPSPRDEDDGKEEGEEGGGGRAGVVRTRRVVGPNAAASVHLQHRRGGTNNAAMIDHDDHGECYLFSGSASPRNNKIWVHTVSYRRRRHLHGDGHHDPAAVARSTSSWVSLPLLAVDAPICHGHLTGHQDWITSFSWLDLLPPSVEAGDDDDDGREGGRGGVGGRRSESLLASSGHDAKIRLWRFSSRTTNDATALAVGEAGDDGGGDDSDGDEADVDDLEEERGEARLTVVHSHPGSAVTAVSLEALLLGHEEAVTSLAWRGMRRRPKRGGGGGGGGSPPCLLSSSMDRTILLWTEEEGGGTWVPISRVGSAGGILGGPIGASLMGFVDAAFSPGGNRIAGHGYGGSVHFWTRVVARRAGGGAAAVADGGGADDDGGGGGVADGRVPEDEGEDEDGASPSTARWLADPCITGHFQSVEDLAWDTNGEYLLSASSDQTTRLWTEVPTAAMAADPRWCGRWVEVGRPQVHGYDMTSIACIGGVGSDDGVDGDGGGDGEPRHRFVSGADEKVLRVFDAPASTLRLLRSISRHRDAVASKGGDALPSEEGSGIANRLSSSSSSSWRFERAFMPSLGLSNKATADADLESGKFSGPVNDDDPVQTSGGVEGRNSVELKLPSERDLGVTTLWPEARKLFGHESELVCLDSYRAPAGKGESSLVASSCKARNDVASAAIRLWDARKGKCVGILKGGHRSTVSTMSFSRDGKYLASSGKDRRICIWKRRSNPTASPEDSAGYELSAAADSAHKRIVWSIHFCPKRPDILASGSRDGLVKIWRVLEASDGALDLKEMFRFEPSFKTGKNPVTAVAFAEDLVRGVCGEIDYGVISIGTESGRIEIWAVPVSSNGLNPSPSLLYTIPSNDSHFDMVKKIAWRPGTASTEVSSLTFASCGRDGGVRIYHLF